MKRFLSVILILCSLVGTVSAQDQKERILDYHSDITVNRDGSLDIVETIKVNAAGGNIKRGIYRDFPTVYHHGDHFLGRLIKKKVPFKIQSVKRNGESEDWHIAGQRAGKRVYIGREDYLLPQGIHTYEISYRTDKQLLATDNGTLLYWNVTGNFWMFPIESASATIHLPDGARMHESLGFTGSMGDTGDSYEVSEESPVRFRCTRRLEAGEGFTIKAYWPSGFVDMKDPGAMGVLKDNLGLFAAFLAFLGAIFYYLLVWFKVGKDPEAGTVVPLYEPPSGFSPAAVRYLDKLRFDDKAFSASIIHLAVNKCLEINESKKKKFKLIRGESPNIDDLETEEVKLFNNLFGSAKTVELKNKNHAKINQAKNDLKKALATKLEKTHFLRNTRYWLPGVFLSILPVLLMVIAANGLAGIPMAIFVCIWSVVIAVIISIYLHTAKGRGFFGYILNPLIIFALAFGGAWVVMIFAMGGFDYGPLLLVVAIICMLMTLLFYHLIKAPTHAGRKVLDHIAGFRKYLSVAEKDRLNLENPPERTPELFEKFLPYALALDVDQEWSEQFSEILEAASHDPEGSPGHHHPHWYSGSAGDFSTATAAALGGAVAGALAASSVSPSSGSSSGGGGGGFSGGGGGGGGGGGW